MCGSQPIPVRDQPVLHAPPRPVTFFPVRRLRRPRRPRKPTFLLSFSRSLSLGSFLAHSRSLTRAAAVALSSSSSSSLTAVGPSDVNQLLLTGAISAELHAKLAGINQIYISPENLPGYARYREVWRRMTPEDCYRLVDDRALLGELDEGVFEEPDPVGAYAYDAAAAVALAMREADASAGDDGLSIFSPVLNVSQR